MNDDPSVYVIRCKRNDRCYVGATMNGWEWRVANHLSLLRRGKHKNKALQKDWDSFGEAGFEFFCETRCEFEDLLKAESEAYAKWRSMYPEGYNLVGPPKDWGMDTSGRFKGRKKLGKVLFAKRVDPSRIPALLKALEEDGVSGQASGPQMVCNAKETMNAGVYSATLHENMSKSLEEARSGVPEGFGKNSGPVMMDPQIRALLDDVEKLTKEKVYWEERFNKAVNASDGQLGSYWKGRAVKAEARVAELESNQ